MEPQVIKPSWPFWVLFVLLGMGAVGGFLAVLVPGFIGLAEDMINVDIPGETTLNLKETGTYTIFRTADAPGGRSSDMSDLNCSLTRTSDGREIPLTVPTMSQKYSYNDRSGVSFLEFTIDRPGDYTLVTESSNPSMLIIGRDFLGRLFRLIGLAVVVAGGLGLLSLLMFILALVRVSRNSKIRAAQAVTVVEQGWPQSR